MKELLSLTGGYKRHMDYLLNLQEEIVGVQNSLLKRLGHDLVLSGCELKDNQNGTSNIASGWVYVSGEIVRFIGLDNVPNNGTRAFKLGTPVTTDPVEFFDSSVKNTYKETFAIIADVTNSATQIVIGKASLYDIPQFIADVVQSYGQKGEAKWVIDLDGRFLNNFDSSGTGVTPKWLGWHLMNGNGGAPSMAGRTPVGVGRFIDAYGLEHTYTNNQEDGQPRHKLTEGELAKHSHQQYWTQGSNGASGSGGTLVDGYRDTSNTGNDQPHNNMPPYRVGYWVIKL